MLGALGDFSEELPIFASNPLSAQQVDMLRRRPSKLLKAYRSACHELHPDQQADAPLSTQVVALALLQMLAVAHEKAAEAAEAARSSSDGQALAVAQQVEDDEDDDGACIVS